MSDRAQRAAEWVYGGIWRVMSDWFRVPEEPPTLKVAEGEFIRSFHPSRSYLSYLKLYFWIGLLVIDLAILVIWIIVFATNPAVGLVMAAPAFVVAVLPDVIAYIAVHLRYDTMWYVMTDRSLRCRRGIWVILEHTITFENVQNVSVHRGPVEYLFGISTIVIETAGAAEGDEQNKFAVGNKAIMQGIDNAEEVRELILDRVRRSRSAGLGDEGPRDLPASTVWKPGHIEALHEILNEVRRLERA